MKCEQWKRQWLAGVSAAILLTGAALGAQDEDLTQPPINPYSDVQEQAWYYPYVMELTQAQVITGYDDGRFGPEDSVTVGSGLIMVLKAAGYGEQSPDAGGHWASGYAALAEEKGFLADEEMENLDAVMSRGRFAKLTARALGLEQSSLDSPFSDTQDGYVTALYQRGIVSGSWDTSSGQRMFYPDNGISRAEMSAIVWQVSRGPLQAGQIAINNQRVDILKDVPVNTYIQECFSQQDGMISYYDGRTETALGVDVSSYQGEIDWERVKQAGIEFAMLRVGGRGYTVGAIYDDACFARNIRGALDAGLEVGVYFFSQAVTEEEAREEADYVLDKLEGYDLSYPVVYDWENISQASARTDGLDADTLGRCANAFCRRIEQAGYQPMVYFNANIAYLHYDLSDIAAWPFWLAQYADVPTFFYDFDMWQYSSSGTVDGIPGPVDMNLRFFR